MFTQVLSCNWKMPTSEQNTKNLSRMHAADGTVIMYQSGLERLKACVLQDLYLQISALAAAALKSY